MPLWPWIAAAGALGALARWGVYRWLATGDAAALPWATIAVNCAGSFAFGVIATLAEEAELLPPWLRVALLTGFLGAFTTFSTFAFESAEMLRLGYVGRACLNAAVQNVGAVLCVFAGQFAARALAG